MRILIVHQNFIDHRHPGGTRHLDLAKQLVKDGHEVTIIASTVDYLTGQRVEEPSEAERLEAYGGVKVRRAYALPCVQKGLIWRTLSYLSFVPFALGTALRSGPADIVFGTTPPIFQLPVPWLAACFKRAPFVLEVRDLWPDFAIGMGVLKNKLLIAMARFVERFFYRRATHIIGNSPAYIDAVAERGVDRRQLSFLANAVDLDLFHPQSHGDSMRQQLGLQDKFVVTYAGAIGMANDIDTILRAAHRLKDQSDIHFLIAGEGKERSRLQEAANAQQLTNVSFSGHFPKTDIGKVLAASDVGIATLLDIPEFRSPFPNKVFDYMAAGRPVLLAIDGAARTLVENAGAGLAVPPGDDEAIAAAVKQLRDDPGQRQQMGSAGRDYIEREHTLQGQVHKLEAIFEQALADK